MTVSTDEEEDDNQTDGQEAGQEIDHPNVECFRKFWPTCRTARGRKQSKDDWVWRSHRQVEGTEGIDETPRVFQAFGALKDCEESSECKIVHPSILFVTISGEMVSISSGNHLHAIKPFENLFKVSATESGFVLWGNGVGRPFGR